MTRIKVKGSKKIIYDAKLKGKVLLLDRDNYKEIIAAMKASDLQKIQSICSEVGVNVDDITYFKCKL